MRNKTWYEVTVDGETLAKVKSQGLAHLTAQKFREIYKDKEIRVK